MSEIYTKEYFTNNPGSREQGFWDKGQIRNGDQYAAIGYALGRTSFKEIQDVVGFEGIGDKVMGIPVKETLQKLRHNRNPKHILEIGGGRGEISVAFSYLRYDVTMYEPCAMAGDLIFQTIKKLGIGLYDDIDLYAGLSLKWITDFSLYDTIIFCESIEHIAEDEIRNAFELIKQQFKGLVIITNWIDFHPIIPDGTYHITRIDDAFYHSLGGEIIYHEGSHLILKF